MELLVESKLTEKQKEILNWAKIHGERVGELSYILSKFLGLEEEECNNYRIGGQDHDVGKIGIPYHIVTKPTRLTSTEFEIMKKHSEISYFILKKKGFNDQICNAVRYMHESYNGTGYPKNLRGIQIPYGARILKITDYFDAMVSPRPYKGALSVQTTLEVMKSEKYVFDPIIFANFIKLIENGGYQNEKGYKFFNDNHNSSIINT